MNTQGNNPIQREKKVRCHWCSQFLSKENAMATLRSPDVFYCRKCYKKGKDMENEIIYAGL